MEIMQNRMDREFFRHQKEYEKAALDVLRSGRYVLGENVQKFEKEFAEYMGENFCVGVASGLDALRIAFRALEVGVGDEVIVQGNTYIASVMGITMNGATPVFVEPDIYFNIDSQKIEEKITDKTKAVLVVHLYGQASDMENIVEICKRHKLYLVEDCAQAHGAKYNGKYVGSFGDVGCFSFYPSKNLGAFGDAGAIITNNMQIRDFARMFRNYGSEKRYCNKVVGLNSRLDELQAALLRVKLKYLDLINKERKEIAEKYNDKIVNKRIVKPIVRENADSVWHQYVIQCDTRDELMEYLKERGINTIIHYPIPPHLSEAYKYLNICEGKLPLTEQYAREVLSLPIYNGMTKEEQDYVIKVINEYS